MVGIGRRTCFALLASLAASLVLLPASAAESRDFWIDPIPVPAPDVDVTLLAPPALARAAEAPIFVRVRNLTPIAVQLAGVELLARWSDGTPAGTVDTAGALPAVLQPQRSAWIRFRWRAPQTPRDDGEPILLSACASLIGGDVSPGNDCDLALRTQHTRAETLVVDDDFEPSQLPSAGPSRWDWWHHGTGQHALTAGVAELTVTSESHAGEYSDAEINDYRRGYERGFPWEPGVRLEIRARASDDNGVSSPVGRGTRGFGFWNLGKGGDGAPDAMSNAWFISISPETFGGFGLFAATVFDRGRIMLFQPLAIDLRHWHDYGIVWTPGGVTFLVDRRPVAATAAAPDDALGFVAWIDNYRLTITAGGITTSFLDLDNDQTLFVDRVRLWSLTAAAAPDASEPR